MIEDYFKTQLVNGISKHTLRSERSCISIANSFKLLETWDKDDVNSYIIKMQDKYSKSTVEGYKIILRKYFRYIGKDDIVKHLKIKACKNELERGQILTTADINTLIESTSSIMLKALVALTFESGARIQEVLSIKVSHIQETNKGMIVSIPATKTGVDYRRVLCVFSAQYIRNHISYSTLHKDNLLFQMHKAHAWKLFIKLGKDANINKPTNPHSMRHAQCIDMITRGYNESVVRKKLGWTGDSKMIGRYSHVVDDDVINSTAELSGIDTVKKPMENMKKADTLNIIDAGSQLSKLSSDNQELKDRLSNMEELINSLAHGEEPRKIGMVKKWIKL